MKKYFRESINNDKLISIVRDQEQQLEDIIKSHYLVIQKNISRAGKEYRKSMDIVQKLAYVKNDLIKLEKILGEDDLF